MSAIRRFNSASCCGTIILSCNDYHIEGVEQLSAIFRPQTHGSSPIQHVFSGYLLIFYVAKGELSCQI
ncbi:hypothetical protein SUGI_0849050 [Cryptomeria japonica]|nr:hypothetical protein SUGI_0849050 [Cryptomeria japonica]